MLSKEQILEIREHLEKSQNPVFFYDNDADGLCSYILLRRFIDRGKGVAVRSHPDVDEGYAKKAQELNADYVFVLDRPVLGERFVEEIGKLQLPLVWIDHHDLEDEKDYEHVFKYNPTREIKVSPRTQSFENAAKWKKSDEPVSYWAYKVANREEDVWIAVMGCIADHYLPNFSKVFEERWGDYWGKDIKEPFDAYYGTEIGRLARVMAFGLKDSVTHVVRFQNFLLECRDPGDMFLALESSRPFALKYRELNKKYDALVDKAKEFVEEKVLFFVYGGDLSISSEISNELSYKFKGRVIVVAYTSGPITNISMRGKNVRELLLDILEDFKNATGGGHMDAVGARIDTDDLGKFKEELLKRI